MEAATLDQPATNGRYDDGVEEISAADDRREQARIAAIGDGEPDNDAEDDFAPVPMEKREAAMASVGRLNLQPIKPPVMKSVPTPKARLVTCDKYPGEKMTVAEWAVRTGFSKKCIYQSAYVGKRSHGHSFAFIDGTAPAKPKHVPRKYSRRKPASSPAPTPRPAPTPSAAPALTGAQIAALVTALGPRPMAVEIESAVDWAMNTLVAQQELASVLAGVASIRVGSDAIIRVHPQKT